MNTIRSIRPLLAATFSLALTVLASASQEALAKALADTQVDVTQAGNQLLSTVRSLTALTSQEKGDLKPAFDTFSADLAATQAAAKVAADRAATLAAASTEYFTAWQTEVNGINNPELKAKAVKRMTAVQSKYAEMAGALKATAAKCQPFLSDLKDIKTTLSLDLTADGVKSVRSISNRAADTMNSVHGSLADTLSSIAEIHKMLGSSAGGE